MIIINQKIFNSLTLRGYMELSVIIEKDEDIYVAKCPEIGTVSQGKSIEEAIANLKEATELYLEEFPVKMRGRPLLTTFEVKANVKA